MEAENDDLRILEELEERVELLAQRPLVKALAKDLCDVVLRSTEWPVPEELIAPLRARTIALGGTDEGFEEAFAKVVESRERLGPLPVEKGAPPRGA